LEKFKISNDPQFEEKVRDVVGLYLNLPARPDKPPKLGVSFSGGNVDLNALPWLP
jgi:hypothetical protein